VSRTTARRTQRPHRRRLRDHADGPRPEGYAATREPSFLLARPEKRLLEAIARRLPSWVLPNDLTALGVVAAVGIGAA
jgi:hypothetical protein